MSAYTDAVSAGLEGMHGVSTGECPGCEVCAERHGMTSDEHDHAWRECAVEDEPSFSWRPCGICGSTLGGDRHTWHWLSIRAWPDGTHEIREINHEDDVCTDCVLYLANGDEPEEWRRR